MPASESQWLLTASERGNPHTVLDQRRRDGLAWSAGNDVTPLIHGAVYYRELAAALAATGPGDIVMFTDWRGDPDEQLDASQTGISRVLEDACRREVDVRGLIWRSHWDKLQFSEAENRHLGEEIDAAGGQCLLDMRVRAGGSHHQKMVVIRHPAHPERDVAFIGGIDLCHSRRDDNRHLGDPQIQRIAPEYGSRPPWHDIQLAVRGPAVGDLEATFRERWNDPSALSRNPLHRLRDTVQRDNPGPRPLHPRLPDPPRSGRQTVQVLRTYPYRRHGYPFAPDGERSAARGYAKALRNARHLIYIEDQYLWSEQVAEPFARALEANHDLRLIAIVPAFSDNTGLTRASESLGRRAALSRLYAAGGDRVAVYGLRNAAGTPIYVHAKTTIIDDTWTSVGSDNLNIRSWTHDSEVSCAIIDDVSSRDQNSTSRPFGMHLRLALAREHLGRSDGDDHDLRDPRIMFEAFRESAAAHTAREAARPAVAGPVGQLSAYVLPEPTWWQRVIGRPVYRWVCDPDGRRRASRRRVHMSDVD